MFIFTLKSKILNFIVFIPSYGAVFDTAVGTKKCNTLGPRFYGLRFNAQSPLFLPLLSLDYAWWGAFPTRYRCVTGPMHCRPGLRKLRFYELPVPGCS